jgi:DNA-binding HxlR family transcriptional regulator
MQRASFAAMECPIARAVDEVGDGWTLLVLREAYKGAATFGEFQERLPVAPTTLTRKLEALTASGFFTREPYQTGPTRERYVLTPKAEDLLPVMLALGSWGNRWLAPRGEPLTVADADGVPLEVGVVDRKTGRPLRPGHVALIAGPGASKQLRNQLKAPLVLGARRRPA